VRAVVQRVASAQVTVANERVSQMGEGLLAFVGVGAEDGTAEAEDLARRIVQLRIFNDSRERMNRSLIDVGGSLGVVSQFTLYGDVRQGRRPFFGNAAPADRAAPLLATLVASARELGVAVIEGRFGAAMEVALVNRGPVTILLDTEKQF